MVCAVDTAQALLSDERPELMTQQTPLPERLRPRPFDDPMVLTLTLLIYLDDFKEHER